MTSDPQGKAQPLKDEAARRCIATDLNVHMLVEAGAGSGKTHMLAVRMAAGVAAGTYDVRRMAAVTFTRKAAAELRGRFQRALEVELANTSEPARASRCQDALANLERFFAGTIHAFCARLLRERPVEAGLSPGFTELDDIEMVVKRKQSWRDYRTEARAADDPDVRALIEEGIEPGDLDDAFAKVCTHEDVVFPAGDAPRPVPAAEWKAADQFLARLSEKLIRPIERNTTCRTQKALRQHVGINRVASADRTNARVLAQILALWDFDPNITQNRWADDSATKKRLQKEIAELHAGFRMQVVEPYLLAWRQYVYRLAIPVLIKARERHRLDRQRDGTLNYGDLLQITARLLRANEGVRKALQEKYRWIFVDEFQDTDPIQAEILFLLAQPVAVGGLETAGQLFVVGDPKQSIFRFTRADIDSYNEVRAPFEAGMGEVVSLTTNFRSVPALCAWANDMFSQRFPPDPTAYSPPFAPLDAVVPATKDPALCTLTVPATVTKQADVAKAEAKSIAEYIRAEVDAGRREYGDFLILTRKKGGRLTPYTKALEALRIPLEVSGAGAFGESEEVRTLALLLRAMADPQDSVSLVGVLRGVLFGFSDRDLFDYRSSGGWFSIFAMSAHPVGAALASLCEMQRWMRVLPAGAALDRILESTGYLALAATTPDGVEAGDLLHAIDRVRTVVEAGGSLLDAADALDEDAEESTDVESLPLEPGQPDVVRLMNLHKAKGLEADVVFLADPFGSYESRVDIRIVRGAGGSPVGYVQITKKKGEHGREIVAEPAGWAEHEAEELRYLAAECDRLMYVAATRARERCVVGRWAKTGGAPAWDPLDAFLNSAEELPLPLPVTVSVPAEQKVNLSPTAGQQAAIARDAAHARARKPSWASASVTAETKIAAKIAAASKVAAAAPAVDDPTRVLVADTPSRRADAGIAWGTLVHALLEHAMRHQSATRDDLRRLAMWLTMDEPALHVVIDQALDTVQAVAGAEFWKVARASAEVHEEAPFAVREDRDALSAIVNGTIDLVYRAPDAWRIVDYKTDADADTDELRQRYAAQVEAYRRAWGQFAVGPVSGDIRAAR